MMRMDIDVDTRSFPRSMVPELSQHQKHHSSSASMQSQNDPRHPPGAVAIPISENIVEEETRGRERDRDSEPTAMDTSGSGDGAGVLSSTAEGPSRKRRRSRKGLDKKFECQTPGCGRTYSRAEHLYRHQLNHQPKQIFHCDYPDCKRSFVRQDLCTRHRERHTNRGSQLQRKDQFLNPAIGGVKLPGKDNDRGSQSPDSPSRTEDVMSPPMHQSNPSMIRGVTASSEVSSPGMSSSTETIQNQKTKDRAKMRRTTGETSIPRSMSISMESSVDMTGRRYSIDQIARSKMEDFSGSSRHSPSSKAGFSRPSIQTSMSTPNMNGLSIHSPYAASSSSHPYSSGQITSASGAMMVPSTGVTTNGTRQAFVPQNGLAPFTLPPPEYPMSHATASGLMHNGITSPPTSSSSMDHVGTSTMGSVTSLDNLDLSTGYAVPVFGGDGFNRSPHTVTDDWASWFFSDIENPGGVNRGSIPASAYLEQPQTPAGYYTDASSVTLYHPTHNHHPMSVTSIIAPPSPPQESLLTEIKREELLEMINGNNFQIRPLSSYGADSLPGGESILSLTMMQQYISNYWTHFHPQLPILHKPTFNADKAPNLLLMTIMTIGACCVNHRTEPDLAAAAGELAKDLAWNLRWFIFSDDEFKPPAKLWVFQALILLETYEKMYSTRQLHERAHIHHATTLTLMRRGSSLTGKPADSPASHRDGSNHGGTVNATSEDWWNKWIQSEATKRAAFAAFVLDSTHATMFGHSATMVAHEIQLALPCDEGLWACTSASEALRLEQTLTTVGVKPITFLEGLKRTLNGQKVQTNTFGRTVLMAGLLSVSYHMHQRDLQVTAVGTSTQFGGPKNVWRKSLTRAFDLWKKDFDESLKRSKNNSTSTGTGPFDVDYFLPSTEDVEHESTFESRIVLHHLAHMAMHVDIVDLQIYAGASRLLGKAIGPADYAGAQRRMTEWAPTARARDATFYALRFLSQVLLPEESAGIPLDDDESNAMGPSRRMSTVAATTGVPVYSARDDHLLNRPWVLHFATLIVWSYGYALEGPLQPPVKVPQTPQECYADMRAFLRRVGGVRAPEELATITGRNACLGLIVTLRDMFMLTRWELMGEAAKLLNTGFDILTGRS